jgi:hypothetical protein
MVTNDFNEIDLMNEESELDEVKKSVKSDWGKIMAAGLENIISRNPKILTAGFGVPEEVVRQAFNEQKPTRKIKCPMDGCCREI